MKYVLENFAKMTSGYMPGVNTDLLHRFIQGFVPHYFSMGAESADANFHQKINPPYPLVLSPRVVPVRSAADKYPVLIIANERDALGKVIYATNLWEFFVDDASETSLGIPSGTPASNVSIDAAVFNGKILTSHPLNANLYHGAIDATPAWTATTGEALATGNTRILKTFEDRCLVTDASSGSFSRSDEVKIVLPDFSVINGIELGDTFHILDIGDYQDRYALLFTQKTTGPRLSRHTTVFLWNVVPGDSYDQKLALNGVYKCHAERDGVIHAFTQVGTTVVCSVFEGGSFREVGRLKNTIISTPTNIPKSRVSVEGEFFVLLATSPGNTTNTSPLYWNPYTGESFYLIKAVSSLPFRALLIAQDPTTFLHERYFSFQNSGSVGFLYKLTLEDSTKADMGASYKSNFIPAPKVKGIHDDMAMGRMQIDHIEIEYSAPPPSVSDLLTLTLTTKDEYENETYTAQIAVAKDTTAHSTSAKVDAKRAIIELGANATEFAIDLAATVATTSWNLVIRRIIVHYTPIALQQ